VWWPFDFPSTIIYHVHAGSLVGWEFPEMDKSTFTASNAALNSRKKKSGEAQGVIRRNIERKEA
jgi:hypothetical protein